MKPPRHIVCVGTIVLRGDRCLLVRQAETASLAGQWSIPWGFVDERETPDAAVEREALEEAGIAVRVTGVVAIQVLPGNDGGIGIVFFAETVDDSEPKGDGSETDEARFLTAQEIEDLPVESWCRQLALRAIADPRALLVSTENPYDLPGWSG